MKHCIIRTSVLLLLIAGALNLAAGNPVKGRITDSASGSPVEGVSIRIAGSEQGTISNHTGNFSLILENGDHTLVFTHISYKSLELAIVAGDRNEFIEVSLDPGLIGLDEVSVISTYARERETPIAVTTIRKATIERESAGQEYPEVMKMTPGVYATRLGGGTGDARISIRGFQQENLGLLLNGIPVSSVENGLVYWSNWAGLGEATQSIQVQRGLGASRVALNSVGGTINIITRTTDARKGGSMRYDLTGFGNRKATFSVSTGILDNGIALTFLGSRTSGPGFVDATHVDSWAWFLSVSKTINAKHMLVFTGMGAPERHGQRNYGLTQEEYNRFGNRYNPNWGMFNGKINSLSENFYHKPQLALNHYWTPHAKTTLSSSAYVSFGTGGGKFSESFMSDGALTFRKNNQIDWDAIYYQNITHNDSAQLSNGEYVNGFSKIIQSNYLASHYWFGALSTLNHELNDRFSIISGVHLRAFKSNLREEISDLLGGNFWIDRYAWSLAGPGGRNQIKGVGDIINVDTDSRIEIASMFGQLEYRSGRIGAFLAGTLSGTRFRRSDRINYIGDIHSEVVSKPGFDVKTGLNYNPDRHHNLYFNAGYYSKAPYFTFVFANFTNAVVRDLGNEKIRAAEAGYGYTRGGFSLHLNAYYTLWGDKSMLSRENIQLQDNEQTRALVRGLDALHKGIEMEGSARITDYLTLGGLFSLGDWKWKNDVIAELYDDNQALLGTTEVYASNLYVGDAPQTQLGITGELIPLKNWSVNFNWLHYSRLYAAFDPTGRNNPLDRQQPYRIPDYSVSDLFISYTFDIGGLATIASVNCYNLFDNRAIIRGEDGFTHDIDSFTGFWLPGRIFNVSLKVSF